MAVTVRRLRPSDYDAIVEVLTVCGLEPKVRGRDSRANLRRQLRLRQNVYLGAFEGERLVGTVFGTHDTRKGWINRLAVLPDRQRRGIATRLVRACERGLRAQGLQVIAALIDAGNEASQGLFASLGYETSDIRYFRRKFRAEA